MIGSLAAFKTVRAGRLWRPARISLCAMALALAPQALHAEASRAYEIAAPSGGQSLSDFYAARGGQPLWLRGDGTAGAEPMLLLDYLQTADADGLDPGRYRVAQLAKAIRSARGGSATQVRKADMLLSQAFVAYVRDLKKAPSVDIVWVDPELKPRAPSARQLLEAAADAPSLEGFLADMGWMHPIYAGLRQALASGHGDRDLLRLNLERARLLPDKGRHILVNATAARLTAYEDGEIVDSMKVVVGKPKNPTPMMAALIRYTSLNPYWYVPADLTAERIAPNVLKEGLSYIKTHGYQVMTDWDNETTRVDPATIDWQAVADGTRQILVRQVPGPGNAMGQMKFMFPNAEGVYLHDTPQKELLSEASRLFSGGCVRLEDAPRLARWLYGKPLKAETPAPEQRVDLPEPVPVFITYLTIMPSGTELATFPDVYGRDRSELAMSGRRMIAGR